LDRASPSDSQHWGIVRVMIRLAVISNQLPSAYVLSALSADTHPAYNTGLSDMSRGTHLGRQVAVLRVRAIYEDNVQKVPFFSS
jgi:hypothetical protein